MKRTITIVNVTLMLSVLLFQSVGYVVVYKLWIKKHRHEIKTNILRELPDSSFIVVSVPVRNPESVPLEFEHDEEFKLNGEMYDIVRSEIRNDTIHYYVFHDKKETSLYRALITAVDQRSSQDQASNQRSQLLLSFGLLHYLPVRGEIVIPPIRSISMIGIDHYRIIDSPSTVSTPPPKSTFS